MSFSLRMFQDALDFAFLPACGTNRRFLRHGLLKGAFIYLTLCWQVMSATEHWLVVVHLRHLRGGAFLGEGDRVALKGCVLTVSRRFQPRAVLGRCHVRTQLRVRAYW